MKQQGSDTMEGVRLLHFELFGSEEVDTGEMESETLTG